MKKFIFALWFSMGFTPFVGKAMIDKPESPHSSPRRVAKGNGDEPEISGTTTNKEIEKIDAVEEGRFLKLPDDPLVYII